MSIPKLALKMLFPALLAFSGAVAAANDYSGALKVGTTAAFAPRWKSQRKRPVNRG